jgi:hypothetical protein
MRVRTRAVLLALAAAVLAVAVARAGASVGADALIALPALLLLLPLVVGRYVGAERLVRLVRRVLPAPRRRGHRPVARRRPDRRPAPRGGLLIAVSLARRGPPASALAH